MVQTELGTGIVVSFEDMVVIGKFSRPGRVKVMLDNPPKWFWKRFAMFEINELRHGGVE